MLSQKRNSCYFFNCWKSRKKVECWSSFSSGSMGFLFFLSDMQHQKLIWYWRSSTLSLPLLFLSSFFSLSFYFGGILSISLESVSRFGFSDGIKRSSIDPSIHPSIHPSSHWSFRAMESAWLAFKIKFRLLLRSLVFQVAGNKPNIACVRATVLKKGNCKCYGMKYSTPLS